jgi:hypothetical protein
LKTPDPFAVPPRDFCQAEKIRKEKSSIDPKAAKVMEEFERKRQILQAAVNEDERRAARADLNKLGGGKDTKNKDKRKDKKNRKEKKKADALAKKR